ncbi:hypothetical protein K431DRAFT_281258 [Polychaeton citri CBS 116435]|uniref:F-box domain-containing protein n=1 Tax=Polychaeton citri CBS 116435 TaxID=1314669 RepID=A0A9P4UU41_9PEZI|nr:hypothetical protein K431DRAFT_281258 [Polychaeton citri CBS 116435]
MLLTTPSAEAATALSSLAAAIAGKGLIEPTSSTAQGFDSLPGEILLEILPYVSYSPHGWACLCLTCKKLNHLIKHHEHGLAKDVIDCQFCQILVFFPGIPKTFDGLNLLHHRLEILEDIHSHWLKVTNHGPDLNWLRGRWENIHKAGLLLLYRLQDAEDYEGKRALLSSLPASSLACLLFKMIASIKILRIYGPDPINVRFASDDLLTRSDVELAFEELLLQFGPDFFVAMLKAEEVRNAWENEGKNAVETLQNEIAQMEERQSLLPNGQHRPPTLIASLRRAFATSAECQINENVTRMWEILSSTPFDTIDDEKMGKLVLGEEIGGGQKRMGY